MEERERALQETRIRTHQEIELRSISCTEAERSQQLRLQELSRQEKERQSTVNQLTVQIQDLQDKVTSLNDSRDLHDPETVSSCGLSHVPSHPVIILSRGMLSRDSCLQPDTGNIDGETFF